MEINFQYKLISAKAASINGISNVIKEVTFAIIANDGTNQECSFFPVELDDPRDGKFIRYEDLTQEHICSWVVEKLGDARIDSLKNGLQARLYQMSEQPIVAALKEIKLPCN